VESLGYRRPLAGIRAVAIVAVVGYHVFDKPTDGQFGVDLFFVLSGFLITTLLLESHYPNMRGFYVARARRILPALVTLLVVYGVIGAAEHRLSVGLSELAAATFTTNAAIAWTHVDLSFGLRNLWSLGTEEQFYLVWPIALLLVMKRRLGLAAIVLCVALVAVSIRDLLGASASDLGYGPDARCVGLIAGSLAAVLLTAERRPLWARRARPFAPLAALAVLGLIFAPTGHWTFRLDTTLIALLAVIVLVGALDEESRLAAALSFAPVVYVGRISYSLYLWHWPILIWFWGNGLETTTQQKWAIVAISFAAAAISYHLVEQPFLRRGRRPARIIEPQLVEPTAATT
jgi:peptidoglycan/LPS O-acetylase OafA/YrhL